MSSNGTLVDNYSSVFTRNVHIKTIICHLWPAQTTSKFQCQLTDLASVAAFNKLIYTRTYICVYTICLLKNSDIRYNQNNFLLEGKLDTLTNCMCQTSKNNKKNHYALFLLQTPPLCRYGCPRIKNRRVFKVS